MVKKKKEQFTSAKNFRQFCNNSTDKKNAPFTSAGYTRCLPLRMHTSFPTMSSYKQLMYTPSGLGLRYLGHVATRNGNGDICTNFSRDVASSLQQERIRQWEAVNDPSLTVDAARAWMKAVPFDSSLYELATFEPFAQQAPLPPAVIAYYQKAIGHATGGNTSDIPRVIRWLQSVPCMAVAIAVAQQMHDPVTKVITGTLHFGPWNGGSSDNDIEYGRDMWV